MSIQTTTFEARRYLISKHTLAISNIKNSDVWEKAFSRVQEYAKNNNLQLGPATALYFTWNEAEDTTEVGIGHSVDDIEAVDVSDLEIASIPTSQAVHTLVKGDYSKLQGAHESIWEYMKQNNLTGDLTVEEYTVDPMQKSDPKDWETNIYYLYG